MVKYKRFVLGIDEVGRGPLAGPITVAILGAPISNLQSPISKLLKGIKDSKAISAKKREEWFTVLRGHARDNKIFYAVSSVSNAVIDKIGIAKATRIAIKRSLKKIIKNEPIIAVRRARVLLDGGLRAPQDWQNQQTIPKGDQKIPVIAAASIVAKVTRDRKMARLAKKYPAYGFDVHKGYGTLMHRKAIKKYGLSDIHRKSFCRNIKLWPSF